MKTRTRLVSELIYSSELAKNIKNIVSKFVECKLEHIPELDAYWIVQDGKILHDLNPKQAIAVLKNAIPEQKFFVQRANVI